MTRQFRCAGTEVSFNGTANKFSVVDDLPVNLYVQGDEGSASMRDVTLTLTSEGQATSDSVKFTVLWATITAKHSGVAELDNAQYSNISYVKLPIEPSGGSPPFVARLGPALRYTGVLQSVIDVSGEVTDCIASEFISNIQPNDFVPTQFAGALEVTQVILEAADWYGMAGNGTDTKHVIADAEFPPVPDSPKGMDFDPQTNGSMGKIYAWDAPGPRRQSGEFAGGTVRRLRANFDIWVTWTPTGVNSVQSSEKFHWHTYQSIQRGNAGRSVTKFVDSAAPLTLKAKFSLFTIDEWHNGFVFITTGAAARQVRGIISNNVDTLDLSAGWLGSKVPAANNLMTIEAADEWIRVDDVTGDNVNDDGHPKPITWNLE